MALDDSFKWSHAFAKRINHLYPQQVHDEWQAWREWWKDAYIMSRLIERFGADCVARAVKCAQMTGRGSTKDERARRQIMRSIRQRGGYLPYADRPFAGRRDYHGLD